MNIEMFKAKAEGFLQAYLELLNKTEEPEKAKILNGKIDFCLRMLKNIGCPITLEKKNE